MTFFNEQYSAFWLRFTPFPIYQYLVVIHAALEPTLCKTLPVLVHMQGFCDWRIKVLTGNVNSDISSPLKP